MLPLITLVAAAVTAPAPAACPAAKKVPALLGERADAVCHCATGRQGRIAACVQSVSGKPGAQVKLLVTMPSGENARAEFPLDGPEARKIARLEPEDWAVRVEEQQLGGHAAIRVSALAERGDDYYIGQEVVAFLELDGTKLVRLWTGLGQKFDRRFDSCLLLTEATFRLLPDGRLERSLKTRRSFEANGIDEETERDLKKGCIAAPPSRQVFDFPTAPPSAPGPR